MTYRGNHSLGNGETFSLAQIRPEQEAVGFPASMIALRFLCRCANKAHLGTLTPGAETVRDDPIADLWHYQTRTLSADGGQSFVHRLYCG